MLLLLLGGELGFPAGLCHSSSGERGLRNVFWLFQSSQFVV